jgi:uncharacterized protein YkwD
MGAFAINSMLNPYSEEDHEKELKEKCMLGRCDTEKLAFLIHDKINEERKQNGLKELSWDSKLALIAEKHSKDMGQREYYSHVTPEGLEPTDRANNAGYSCKKNYGSYYTIGISENLFQIKGLIGGYENISDSVVEGWMNSPGHRKNILEKNYDREGIGIAIDNGWQITQNFC